MTGTRSRADAPAGYIFSYRVIGYGDTAEDGRRAAVAYQESRMAAGAAGPGSALYGRRTELVGFGGVRPSGALGRPTEWSVEAFWRVTADPVPELAPAGAGCTDPECDDPECGAYDRAALGEEE